MRQVSANPCVSSWTAGCIPSLAPPAPTRSFSGDPSKSPSRPARVPARAAAGSTVTFNVLAPSCATRACVPSAHVNWNVGPYVVSERMIVPGRQPDDLVVGRHAGDAQRRRPVLDLHGDAAVAHPGGHRLIHADVPLSPRRHLARLDQEVVPRGLDERVLADRLEVVLQAVERRDVRVAAAPAGTRRRIRLVVRATRAAATAPAAARRCRRLLIRLLAEIVERGADQKDLR